MFEHATKETEERVLEGLWVNQLNAGYGQNEVGAGWLIGIGWVIWWVRRGCFEGDINRKAQCGKFSL